MPTLGFLKKKRTREGNTDPASTCQPANPVTPTAAKSFDQTTLVPPASAHSNASTAVCQSGAPPKQEPQPEKVLADTMPVQPAQLAPPVSSPPPGTEPQNLPSISNLINPPQHDGAAQTYQQAQPRFSHSPANGGAAPAQPAMPPAPQPSPSRQQDQSRVTKGKYSLVDFEILRTLGTGSFGRVHLVQSRHNQRFYAVKVLKKAQVVKMKQVEHTNDERRMLGEVKHPFLITLWGTFQDARNLYMVMDFVEGGELFSLLRKSGVRPRHKFARLSCVSC